MTRTTLDIDDELCAQVMMRHQLKTRQEAVELALRRLAGEPLTVNEARALRGSGWDGELDLTRERRC